MDTRSAHPPSDQLIVARRPTAGSAFLVYPGTFTKLCRAANLAFKPLKPRPLDNRLANPHVLSRYADGCQPASAQMFPLTAELRIMKLIVCAISSGLINRRNCVFGIMCSLMKSSPSARTIGVSV